MEKKILKIGLVFLAIVFACVCLGGEEQVTETPQVGTPQPGISQPETSQARIGLTTGYMHKIPSGVYSQFPKLNGSLIVFSVTNIGTDVLKVTVSSEISGYTDKAINTEQIAPGKTKIIKQTPLFKPGILDTLTELRSANLHYKVTYLEDGKETTRTEQTKTIELYAKDTMIWGTTREGKYVDHSPYIAAWVTPHAREVDELIRVAAENHPQKSMGAAAAKTPEERREQVKAIYTALQDYYEITYISASISYAGKTENSQRVKLPKDAINLASANCIDGTVLFASALESLRIDPYIVMIPGHAFLAWETGAGTVECLETTMVKSATFEEALNYGRKEYNKEIKSGNFNTGVSRLISIKYARGIGITPMQ